MSTALRNPHIYTDTPLQPPSTLHIYVQRTVTKAYPKEHIGGEAVVVLVVLAVEFRATLAWHGALKTHFVPLFKPDPSTVQ